jgi:hypothetical protein
MLYDALSEKQKLFFKEKIKIEIEDREYSDQEMEDLFEANYTYLLTQTSIASENCYDHTYPDALMCESIIDVFVDLGYS